MTLQRVSYLNALLWIYLFQLETLATTLKTQVCLGKFKPRWKNGIKVGFSSFMSAPSYPFLPFPFTWKCFVFNKECYMKRFHEYWPIFSRRNKYKFSAPEGFFGVFITLLGITVLAKAQNSGVKSLGNSPITESNSSISSLFVLCTQSCWSHKCGK